MLFVDAFGKAFDNNLHYSGDMIADPGGGCADSRLLQCLPNQCFGGLPRLHRSADFANGLFGENLVRRDDLCGNGASPSSNSVFDFVNPGSGDLNTIAW